MIGRESAGAGPEEEERRASERAQPDSLGFASISSVVFRLFSSLSAVNHPPQCFRAFHLCSFLHRPRAAIRTHSPRSYVIWLRLAIRGNLHHGSSQCGAETRQQRGSNKYHRECHLAQIITNYLRKNPMDCSTHALCRRGEPALVNRCKNRSESSQRKYHGGKLY